MNKETAVVTGSIAVVIGAIILGAKKLLKKKKDAEIVDAAVKEVEDAAEDLNVGEVVTEIYKTQEEVAEKVLKSEAEHQADIDNMADMELEAKQIADAEEAIAKGEK